MKNKFKILGVLIVMAIALCGAFSLNVPKYVFADETSVQETTPLINAAGTFEGVGEYEAGQTATLTATLNVGYDFYWLATYKDGTTEVLGSDCEYSFEAAKATTISVVTKKAGTFTVEGAHATAEGASFFIVGESATLKAVMEPGFKFDKWIATDIEGNSITLPGDASTETYNLQITQNIKVTPTWVKQEYTVTLANGLSDYFDMDVINTTQATGVNYYEDTMQLTISLAKEDLYVKDLAVQNIKVNGVDLYTIVNNNPMNVQAEKITNGALGFENAVIKLDIKQDVEISIDYTKMFKLSIASGNEIPVGDIIKFVKPIEANPGTEYYSKIDDYTYLLYNNTAMSLSFGAGDAIYKLESYKLDEMPEVTNSYSASIKIDKAKTITVKYSIKDYTITFVPYIINLNGSLDKFTEYHSEIKQIVKPGETISYNCATGDIVNIVKDSGTQTFAPTAGVYGYKFKQFEVEGQTSSQYSMSGVNPENAEVKMVFEYVEYSFAVNYVDNYFADDVELSVTADKGLTADTAPNQYKLIKGANVTIKATTTQYQINGWSATNIELEDGNASDLLAAGYTFAFEPNTATDYAITINVGYKYTTAKFSLDAKGCVYDEYNTQHSAKLQISHIEEVKINLLESNAKASVTLSGTIYTLDTQIAADIATFESNVEKVEDGKYKLTYQGYTIYLYMAGDSIAANDKISLPNITSIADSKFYTTDFVYNGTSFVLQNATINTPEAVIANMVKDESNCYIELNNMLPNAILVYSATTTSADQYTFSKFVRSATEYPLGSFKTTNASDVEYNHHLSPITMCNNVSVRYYKLQSKIMLTINNTNAYSYDDIIVEGATMPDAGNPDEANQNAEPITVIEFDVTEGQTFTIKVDKDKIQKGYKFDGYSYNFAQIIQEDAYVLSFTMDRNKHQNQLITLNFSEIEYTVKISNQGGEGFVQIGNSQDNATVVVTGQYTISAIAVEGYYVSEAYIANISLPDLVGSNTSDIQNTSLILSSDNFENLIINNADESNIVTLSIKFTRRSYTVKAYLTMGVNEGLYEYPLVSINDELLNTQVDGVTRYVMLDAIEHGNSVKIAIDKSSFREGTMFDCIKDSNNQSLKVSEVAGQDGKQYIVYTLAQISKDSEYTIKLKYIEYNAIFKSVDADEKEQSLFGNGSVAAGQIITLGSRFVYNTHANSGYALKETYYYNRESQKMTISQGYVDFDPLNFNIDFDGKNYFFTIYLVFDYKVINLKVENNGLPTGMYDGMTASDLATYKVEIIRGESDWVDITEQDVYSVRKDDKLRLTVTPISIGVALRTLSLGDNHVYSNLTPSQFSVESVYEDGNIVGVYYVININFGVDMIDALANELTLENNYIQITNNLEVREYEINYSYNYINYKFGVQLSITVGTLVASGAADNNITQNVPFGSTVQLTYTYSGKDTATDPFIVKGFRVEDAEFEGQPFTQSNLEDLWTSLALNKYKSSGNVINVQLVLTPRIFLKNCDKDSPEGEYRYTTIYNANYQGLNIVPGQPDVSVGGNFNVIIEYSHDGGSTYTDRKPKNAGNYPVRLTAEIKTEDSQPVNIVYNEKVWYRIKPVSLVLTLKDYTQANPIVKEYNGLTSLTLPATLVEHIKLDGLYEVDKNSVKLDASKIRADFSGSTVNSESSLYNLILTNIQLVQTGENYVIDSDTKTFEKVGKINPLPLKIVGFVAYDKVNDGSTEVAVNIDNLKLDGKLEFDSTEIIKENLKFYHEKVDPKFKGPKEVIIDYSEAINGVDSINYTFEYDPIVINIHPYELDVYVNGVGTFKIVDVDKKCLIPLDCKLIARAYTKGSSNYNSILGLVETQILKSENLHIGYEVVVQINGINQLVPEGLYIYMPTTNKVTKVFQNAGNDKTENVEYVVQDGFIVVKAHKGKAIFGVVVKTTYLPLWLIILIVASSLAVVGLIVLLFIIIRRRSKRKYQRFDKI